MIVLKQRMYPNHRIVIMRPLINIDMIEEDGKDSCTLHLIDKREIRVEGSLDTITGMIAQEASRLTLAKPPRATTAPKKAAEPTLQVSQATASRRHDHRSHSKKLLKKNKAAVRAQQKAALKESLEQGS